MANLSLILFLGVSWAWLLAWGVRHLPDERWQFMAAVPVTKTEGGGWRGVNLTFYGFFVASAVVGSAALHLILTGAAGVPLACAVWTMAALILIGVPLSKALAKAVEGKPYTFTIGGASFAGMIAAPLVVVLYNTAFHERIQAAPILAAMAISYALGEGIGRMACLSFGCCYGRQVSDSPFLRDLFSRLGISFSGKTKKIAYAAGGEGARVIPIQAISSSVNLTAALVGTALFLHSYFRTAFVVSSLVSHGWRFFSEFLRADDRGGGQITLYQGMALFAGFYAVVLSAFLPLSPAPPLDIFAGIHRLWSPGIILGLEGLWATLFLYVGRSKVTGSDLAFFVYRDRV